MAPLVVPRIGCRVAIFFQSLLQLSRCDRVTKKGSVNAIVFLSQARGSSGPGLVVTGLESDPGSAQE